MGMGMKRENIMVDIGLLVSRVSLGAYFAIAGYRKVAEEFRDGFGTFLDSGSYKTLQPAWLPDWFAIPYGFVLPWAELLFGAMLILGLLGRVSAALIFLMLLSFTMAIVEYAAWQNSDIESFLFQAFKVKDAEYLPFHPNLLILPLAFLLIMTGPGVLSIDRFIFGTGRKLKPMKPTSKPQSK